MATFAPVIASGSTNGRQIKVAATGTPGTTIHATGTSATIIDEVWIWATNSDTTARKLTVEFGGTTDPDDIIEVTIPPESGPMLVVPGWQLTGTGAAACTVRAYAATANVVTVKAQINRYTP